MHVANDGRDTQRHRPEEKTNQGTFTLIAQEKVFKICCVEKQRKPICLYAKNLQRDIHVYTICLI